MCAKTFALWSFSTIKTLELSALQIAWSKTPGHKLCIPKATRRWRTICATWEVSSVFIVEKCQNQREWERKRCLHQHYQRRKALCSPQCTLERQARTPRASVRRAFVP